jgi:hypothetical protein
VNGIRTKIYKKLAYGMTEELEDIKKGGKSWKETEEETLSSID